MRYLAAVICVYYRGIKNNGLFCQKICKQICKKLYFNVKQYVMYLLTSGSNFKEMNYHNYLILP